jgi:hypothetical protein
MLGESEGKFNACERDSSGLHPFISLIATARMSVLVF